MLLRNALLLFIATTIGCSVPYPLVTAGGPFEVPASGSTDPLDVHGARVQVVAAPPPRCSFLGLASGVGSVKDQYEPTSDARYPEFQARALVAIRNAVGKVGGTHVVIDAEVTRFNRRGLEAVVIRGPALACAP